MIHSTLTAELDLKAGTANTSPPAVDAGAPRNSMTTVSLIVGAAITIFMAFTLYSVRKSIEGSADLRAIQELYFPVLQRLDANIVRVDKLEELYIQVVVAGDRDMIGKAAEIGSQADHAFEEINAFYPGAKTKSTSDALRAGLRDYNALATKASLAFLDSNNPDTGPLAARMNAALAALRKDLNAFRQASYEGFVQTLNRSEHNARVQLYTGLAIGAMNLGFMAVLVFFMRANMKMMGIIAQHNATLEQRVTERTAQLRQKTSDINAMLQNMKLGVSTVTPGNRIHPEYSNHLRMIFGHAEFANEDLIERLFGRSSLGVDAKDQINVALGAILGEETMMFDFNSHLLAQEMQISADDGSRKVVQMDWNPIMGAEGTVERVLLITQDVTKLRELEANAAHQKEELDIVAKILKVTVRKFDDFVESSRAFIRENRSLLSMPSNHGSETLAALFRNMHTVKGNARMYHFTHITNAAHDAEQTYNELRTGSHAWDLSVLMTELEAVSSAIEGYVRVNQDTLGRQGGTADVLTERVAVVGTDELAALRSMAATLTQRHPVPELARLKEAIDQLGLVSLCRIVSGTADTLSSLALELKKPAPRVEIVGGDIGFGAEFAEKLKNCCMHIFRNSLDHGIESPAARLLAGKAERGTILVRVSRAPDYTELRIEDDGQGLALHILYELGLASGLFRAGERPSRQQVAEQIFQAGISTAVDVTQVSGRGVGLDAVRTFLGQQHARIDIALDQPNATDLGFTSFAFIIHVPSAVSNL